MSVVARIDDAIGVTYVVYDGVITADDIRERNRLTKADPAFPPRGKLYLVDAQTATFDPSVTDAVMRETAGIFSSDRSRVSGLRHAIVANAAFEKLQIYESSVPSPGPTVIVFNSLDTACVWLGINADEARRVVSEMRKEARSGNSTL